MKNLVIPMTLSLCVAAGFTARSGIAEPRAADGPADQQKLAALQKERRDVLREIVDEMETRYREGMISYQPVSQAVVEWLNADLELAPDRAGRIAIREQIVHHLRKVEKAFAAEVGVGPSRNSDVLGARAVRLQAEVELLREQMSGQSEQQAPHRRE